MEVSFKNNLPTNQELEDVLKDLNLKSLTLQLTGNNSVLIRYASEDDKINQIVLETLSKKYPESQNLRTDYANASVSSELPQL